MNNFEMIVKNIFYLSDGRMAFVGKINVWKDLKLPFEAIVIVNGEYTQKIELNAIPSFVGNKSNEDSIESFTTVDLKFINWSKDEVILRC